MKKYTGILLVILATTLFFFIDAAAFELEGEYLVEGVSIDGKSKYKGAATIKRNGEVYDITWNVGSGYKGTGLLSAGVLSAVFVEEQSKNAGIASYEIKDSGAKLVGRWCFHGYNLVGRETLYKK